MISGIDVSHFQGTVQWDQVVKAGKAFAFAKATDGITYVDPMFATNWAGMKAAGILRGAYQFFEPNDDAESQAQNFLKTVTLEPGDLPPVLDVEQTSAASKLSQIGIQGIQTWLSVVEHETGRTPILYTNTGFWDQDTGQLGSYPLWIAQYGVSTPKLPANWEWKAWTFWQSSETGTVAGISGSVDLDVFQGTLRQLRQGFTKA